jgi:steroid delta-isomerase-like uncharacterized protein
MPFHYRDLVDRFMQVMFVHHDARAAAAMYAQDATLIDPTTPTPIKGRQAIEKNLENYARAFPDISGEVKNLFGSGDWLVAEVATRGTNTGPLEISPGNTIPPTGKLVETRICWIVRVNTQGLIAEDRTYYDLYNLMTQLGLTEQERAA